jgi:hypothetical protein
LIQKFDQTGYHFLNRSYGIGASAGLVDPHDAISPQWYTFPETEFYSTVKCMRNDTSAMGIDYIESDDDTFYQKFRAKGTFANGANVSIAYPQLCPQRQDIFM